MTGESWRRWQAVGASDRGSSVVGLAVLTPVMAMFLFFVIAAGRVGVIQSKLTTAASGASRAASQLRSTSAAQTAAVTTAEATLGKENVGCKGGPKVYFRQMDLSPGGLVQVQITCAVRLSDLAVPGLPGDISVSADFASPVDRYRGGSPKW